jgi:hypothetical protein
LLIEEQRTNLLLHSEGFDNDYWIKSGSTITANTVVAPDGNLTGDKWVEDSGALSNQPRLRRDISTTGTHSATIYAKAGGRNWLRMQSVFSSPSVWFNLATGTIGTVGSGLSASIQAVGNGWYRCTLIKPSDTRFHCFISDADGSTEAYTGDGTSGIFIYGAQLEVGAFATSYIPSVASQVTRAADNASMIGNNFARWFNVNEGTLYADAYMVTGATVLGVSDGTTVNRIQVNMSTSSNQFFYIANNSNQALFAEPFSVLNSFNKLAFAYKTDSFAGTVNAGTPGVDTSGSVTGDLNRLQIGSRTGTAAFVNAPIKRIAYFNRRLANSELQGITS